MQGHRAKRKSLRMPVCSWVRCKGADNEELGGKASNLSAGGLTINTNSPVRTGEQLTIELSVQGAPNLVNLLGEVVWSQFNYDTPESSGSLFTAGIKFLKVRKRFQSIILDYILEVYWKEFLFGLQEIKYLLYDIQNLPLEERKVLLHNYYFCSLFAEGGCPHQIMMEKAYLIPRFINATDIVEYRNTCWSCGVYKRRQLADLIEN